MRAPISTLAKATAFAIAIALTGCSRVEDFAPRAINFNIQAEDAKNEGILLNIVRAAYRKPLQFTPLSTITETSSLSGQIGATLPLGGPAKGFVFSPQLSSSIGPNFTMSVLDTQEFYRGILTPIEPKAIAYYLETGFPKSLILRLLVSEIEFGPADRLTSVRNDGWGYKNFDSLLNGLLSFGLDVEARDKPTALSPPLSTAELQDIKALAGLSSGDATLQRFSLKAGSADKNPAVSDDEIAEFKRRHPGATYYYQLQKSGTDYRFCFDPAIAKPKMDDHEGIPETGLPGKPETDLQLTPAALCGASESGNVAPAAAAAAFRRSPRNHVPVQRSNGNGVALAVPDLLHGAATAVYLTAPSPEGAKAQAKPAGMSFKVRSVEGVIYYLGEIARAKLNLDPELTDFTPAIPGEHQPWPLFDLHKTAACSSDLTDPTYAICVPYGSSAYYVLLSPAGEDRSTQVMEIVTQLLALHNSAKDLPAPSVIPVITH